MLLLFFFSFHRIYIIIIIAAMISLFDIPFWISMYSTYLLFRLFCRFLFLFSLCTHFSFPLLILIHICFMCLCICPFYIANYFKYYYCNEEHNPSTRQNEKSVARVNDRSRTSKNEFMKMVLCCWNYGLFRECLAVYFYTNYFEFFFAPVLLYIYKYICALLRLVPFLWSSVVSFVWTNTFQAKKNCWYFRTYKVQQISL